MQISSNMYSNSYIQNPFEKHNDETKTAGLNSEQEENKKDKKEDKKNPNELTREEEQLVQKLQARDSEVRAHESAHIAAGAGVVTGGASFTYQKGPDGKQYAIGGEVPVDTSPGSTPEETARKARKIKAAATAPANPSGQDMKIASTASMMEMKATMELAQKKMEESEGKSGKNPYNTPQVDNQKPLNIVA